MQASLCYVFEWILTRGTYNSENVDSWTLSFLQKKNSADWEFSPRNGFINLYPMGRIWAEYLGWILPQFCLKCYQYHLKTVKYRIQYCITFVKLAFTNMLCILFVLLLGYDYITVSQKNLMLQWFHVLWKMLYRRLSDKLCTYIQNSHFVFRSQMKHYLHSGHARILLE